MSQYYATNGKDYVPKYERPGRTKQSFKDSTDINKILIKARKTGTLSHLQKHGAEYGDFSDMPTLLDAHARLSRGQEIFDELPAEVRRDFKNDAAEFFTFVNDPANVGKLAEILPQVAEPGDYVPQVNVVAGLNTGGPEEAPTAPEVVTPAPEGGNA